jgi:hypothetical protein
MVFTVPAAVADLAYQNKEVIWTCPGFVER